MMTNRYFPLTEAAQLIWLGNFKLKLWGYLLILAITLAEQELVTNTNDAFNQLVNYTNALNTYSVAMTEYKHRLMEGKTGDALGTAPVPPVPPAIDPTVIVGLFPQLFALITNIKTRTNFTNDIGKTLGIIGSTVIIDWTHFFANLIGISLYNSIELSFVKKNI